MDVSFRKIVEIGTINMLHNVAYITASMAQLHVSMSLAVNHGKGSLQLLPYESQLDPSLSHIHELILLLV